MVLHLLSKNIGVGHQIFQLSLYCSFVAVKYDGSNMAGMTAANTFKAVESCWTFCRKQDLILSEVF